MSAALGKVQASLTLLSLVRHLGDGHHRGGEHDVLYHACALKPCGSCAGQIATNNSGSDKRELYTIAQALQTSAPHYKRAWRHIFAIELYILREECEVPKSSCIEVVNSLRNAPDGIFEE